LTFEQAIEPITDEGKRVDRSDYLSEGSLPVIDQGEEFIGGFTNDISKQYDGPLPVIVFGDHTRRVKLVDFPFVVGAQGVKLLRPKECWEPRFLAYLLPTLPLPDRGYGRHYQYVRQLKFSCPPRPLQREIVAEIEKQFTRLEAGIAGLRRVQANLKRYRAAVLKAACEGKLVPTEAELSRQEGRAYETGAQLLERILTERRQKWNGKSKYKEPVKPDAANIPILPEGWAWATAEQICEFITKGTTPHADKLRSGSGEVQFLKVYNLTFTGRLDHHYKPVFVDRRIHDGELARSKVKSGDVLINIVGPPLGQVSVVPDEIADANINQAIARFRPLNGVSNRFLSALLQSEPVMSWAIHRAKTTAGQANLTLQLCRELPLPVPPFAEQQRIVAEVERRLSVIEELEAVVNANLQRATGLRQSILQRSFKGES
jgi:type I restriction enzyme S subunit